MDPITLIILAAVAAAGVFFIVRRQRAGAAAPAPPPDPVGYDAGRRGVWAAPNANPGRSRVSGGGLGYDAEGRLRAWERYESAEAPAFGPAAIAIAGAAGGAGGPGAPLPAVPAALTINPSERTIGGAAGGTTNFVVVVSAAATVTPFGLGGLAWQFAGQPAGNPLAATGGLGYNLVVVVPPGTAPANVNFQVTAPGFGPADGRLVIT